MTAIDNLKGWVTRTLGEICDEVGGIIRTGPFGSQLHQSDYQDEGLPVVMPKDIVDGRVSVEGIARIGDEDVERLSQHRLKKGDIVYGRRGDIGRRALITQREAGWLCGTGCLRISLGDSVLNPIFLYYYLGEAKVIGWIYNQAIGATMPNLNTSIIRSIPITYPSLPVQRKIAGILSAYDDLIENNTRRIEILEEMARSLYREWFVNFRFPGHEQVKMVDSELGLIPEGWEALTINNIGAPGKSIVSGPFGSNIGKKFFVEEGVPVIRGNNLTLRNKKFIDNGFVFVTEQKAHELRNCEALPDDIVFTAAGTLGQVGIIPKNPKYQKYIISNKQLRLRCNKDIALPEYIYYWLSTPEMREHIINQNTGSSVPLITLGTLRKIPVLLPSMSIQHQFAAFVVNRDNLVENLERKNANLRQTRDLLLPKLISGEIDVENLEINTGEIAA